MLLWFAACSAVLLAAGAAAELTARWWIHRWSGYYVLPPGLRLRLQPDREVFPDLEPVVRFEVNGDGERGGQPPAVPNLYRVLVAGGSQPEGYLLDQKTAWPGALQQLLNKPEHLRTLRAARVHVGNIARSGVGSEALDVILDRVLSRYPSLSAIVVLVGASDVLRWLEFGAPPAPPPPVRVGDVFRCHPELTFGCRVSQLALVELTRRARHRWLRPVEIHERACRWIARARAMRARATVVRTMTPDPAPMLAHFERHLRRALARATAHADRVILVRQPWFAGASAPEELALMWHGGVGQAWQEEVTTFYSIDVLSSLMARLDAKAAAIAEDMSVEQVDLMPILERSARTYYDFFHATPAGARVIAAAIAAVVLREPVSAPVSPRHVAPSLPTMASVELARKVS
jgi:lysophospholipase L1-like esterase